MDAMLHLPPSSPAWGFDTASGVHYLVHGWRIANVVQAGDKWQLNVTWGAMDTARTVDTLADAKAFCEAFGDTGDGSPSRPFRSFLPDIVPAGDGDGDGDDDPGVQ